MRGERLEGRSGTQFLDFYFPKFHLFLPPSRHFVLFADKNALFDPDLRFPIFYFPKFHLFRLCLGRFFVFLVFFVAMP